MSYKMVQTRKRLKTTFESVLFNSDILVCIGPFLAAEDVVNLASTSRHFGGRTHCVDHDNDNAINKNYGKPTSSSTTSSSSTTDKASTAKSTSAKDGEVYQATLKYEEEVQNDSYAWCCDYCKLATFPTFAEAALHESKCTVFLEQQQEKVGLKDDGKDIDKEGEQNLSLMEKIACQVIKKEQTRQERAALPRYPGEGWISLYHQLLLLRKPIIFDRLVGRVGKCAQYVDGDKSRVILSANHFNAESAVSDHVMRAGKHYVEVSTRLRKGLVGVMRPVANCLANHPRICVCVYVCVCKSFSPTYFNGCSLPPNFPGERNERWGDSNVNGCQYSFHDGYCCWGDWKKVGMSPTAAVRETWEGQEGLSSMIQAAGNITLGLLLDLDEGTLSVYKNGRRLGTMKTGLSGEYCWVVSSIETGNDEVSIRRAKIPINE